VLLTDDVPVTGGTHGLTSTPHYQRTNLHSATEGGHPRTMLGQGQCRLGRRLQIISEAPAINSKAATAKESITGLPVLASEPVDGDCPAWPTGTLLDIVVLGAADVVTGTVEVDAAVLDAADVTAVELGAAEVGTVELGAGELGVAEEHVVVGKNCPRVWPEACASTWTKHLPSPDSSSATVTVSPELGPMSKSSLR
jgi:hypothetical protein